MKPKEFIETYSDDILYLYDMREAMLTHPFKETTHHLFSASFSRIYCVFIIGNIESMIKQWSKYIDNNILSGFFDKNKSNFSKINNLYEAFIKNGINADKEILNDYLAIKYLRNTIIHSDWKENHKSFILERGFPLDSRDLNDTHLQKMKNVNENMMFYIAMLSFFDSKSKSFSNNDSIIRTNVALPEADGIIRKEQLPQLIWNNLKRIIDRFDILFEDIQNPTNDELLYLAEESLFFWEEYKRYRTIGESISKKSIISSLDILKDLLQSQCFMKFPIGTINLETLHDNCVEKNISDEEFFTLLNAAVKYSAKDVLKAIINGKNIYNNLPSLSIFKLFVHYLPRIVPERNDYFIKEAKEILTLFEISRYYYHYIEQDTNILNLNKTIESYKDKIKIIETPYVSNE